MADQSHPNGCQYQIDDQPARDMTAQGDTVASTSLDPRLVTIAPAIGRLIAQERFQEQTEPSEHEDQ